MTQRAKDIDPGFARMMRGITSSIAPTDDGDAPIDLGVLSGFVASGDDQRQEIRHNSSMETPITRPELDAKLETIEARMDGRIARIEDAVQRISEDNAATRAGISSLKTTLIVTAIGAVLTIVLGVAAFNATLQSNMLSAFQVGQQVSQQK
ncbi:hypothetical protein ABRY94_11895 [Castellaniella ginsengisoli]|uniref:Chemotaxis protein n=1 Tax=Castellaniella ginsengisoli TaxID=546114 RepID=A0AB39ETC9_9BURK